MSRLLGYWLRGFDLFLLTLLIYKTLVREELKMVNLLFTARGGFGLVGDQSDTKCWGLLTNLFHIVPIMNFESFRTLKFSRLENLGC